MDAIVVTFKYERQLWKIVFEEEKRKMAEYFFF